MTYPAPEGLLEGTLADLRTLMSHPSGLRRGATYLLNPANPAANAPLVYKVDSAWWERIVSLLFTFTASAVAGLRTLAIVLANADGVAFNITPGGPSILAGQTWQISSDLLEGLQVFAGPSQDNTGNAAAPAAGATIASLTLPAGEYAVNWTVELGGTPGAGDLDNFGLFVGANQVAQSVNPGAVGGPWPQLAENVVIPAGGAVLAVKAIGIGTAGSTYQATVAAAEDSANLACPQLPDLILKSSWQLQVTITGGQAGDQISGVQILTERHPSNWADGSLGADLEQLLEPHGQ